MCDSYIYVQRTKVFAATQFITILLCISGFGGLGVARWPLVPKFTGSNPAEAVRNFTAKKNPQHAFLRRGSKAVGSMS